MHGQAIAAIFQGIILGDRGAGQLAVLADQQQPAAELAGQCRAKDETARLDRSNQIRPLDDGAGKALDRRGQPLTIKLKGDVDAWFRLPGAD